MATELIPIPNSSIDAAGYDLGSQTLAVRFKPNGPVYHYKDVPPDVAEAFDKAESKGRFLQTEIRGAFDHEVIPPEES